MTTKAPNVPTTGKELIVATGLWSRRKLRRIKQPLHTADGPVDAEAAITLTAEWQSFAFRGWGFEARLAYQPLIVLHKPAGVLTSRRSKSGTPTVFELLNDPAVEDIEPVGRLDQETTGVLLFTADGQLLHRLTHPRWGVARTYIAKTEAPVTDEGVEALVSGDVSLRDGHVPTPTSVRLLDDTRMNIELTLTSGKYHEVRRMLAAVGAPVLELHRTQYADVHDSVVASGESQRLPDAEVERVYEMVSMTPERNFLEIRFPE